MNADVDSPRYVIVFAATVSATFTAAIMALHAATEGAVERNAQLSHQRALVEAFGLEAGRTLTDEEVRRAYAEHVRPRGTMTDPGSGAAFEVYEARQRQPSGAERVAAYAFGVWGVGFWARIDGYLAVTPELSKVVGIVFVKHAETPGLGGRITEAAWRGEFVGLDVRPPAPGGKYVYVGGDEPAGPGSPRSGRRVDAISGATGTSQAVEKLLNQRIAEFRRAAAAAGLTAP